MSKTKDRVVLLSKNPAVQKKITEIAGFLDVHNTPKLDKAKIDGDFWHRPDGTLQGTTFEELHLKVVNTGEIKDIAIVSSKDCLATHNQPETFYVRVQHGDTTYVGVSISTTHADFVKKYFNPKDTVTTAVVRESIAANNLIVVTDAAKNLAPVEMVLRLAAGQDKPVVEKEGYVLNKSGGKMLDSSNYMSVAPKVLAQKNRPTGSQPTANVLTPVVVVEEALPSDDDQGPTFIEKAPVVTMQPKTEPATVVKGGFASLANLQAKLNSGVDDHYAVEKDTLKRLAGLVAQKEELGGKPVFISKAQANVLQYIMLLGIAGQSLDPANLDDHQVLLNAQMFADVQPVDMGELLKVLKKKQLLTDSGKPVLFGPVNVSVSGYEKMHLSDWFKNKLVLGDFEGQSPIFTEEEAEFIDQMTDQAFADAAFMGSVQEVLANELTYEIDAPHEVSTAAASEVDVPLSTMNEQQANQQDIVGGDYPVLNITSEQASAVLQCFISNGVELAPGEILKMQNAGGFTLKIQD